MKDKILASIYAVLGALVAFGPTYLFKVCQGLKADGTPMKCHWMAQAELGVGLAIVLVAVLMFIAKSNETKTMLSITTAGLAIVAFLMPRVLIGVCKTATMSCVALTLPALTIITIVLFLAAVIGIVLSLKK